MKNIIIQHVRMIQVNFIGFGIFDAKSSGRTFDRQVIPSFQVRCKMETLLKDCLFTGLKSKGFRLDFEAKADMAEGFACYIFSNKDHVAIITSEHACSKRRCAGPKTVYRHYCCRIGDDEYLRNFLESEDIIGNLPLLNGEFGILFMTLINKVKSYGTKNAELLIRPTTSNESVVKEGAAEQYSGERKIIRLSDDTYKSYPDGNHTPKSDRPIQNSISK